jgi:cytidylate kinase
MAQNESVVMDGRDIGTVVFPDAELKIFVTADDEVRAKRRYDELTAKGEEVTLEAVLANLRERDLLDTTREESPLRKAADAILLDNSFMTREEQFEVAKNFVERTMQE